MTNPVNKYTEEIFKQKVMEKIPSITNITEYKGVDYKLKVHCIHGINERQGWSVLNGKNCCRKGFYESGKMWSSTIISPNERLEWYKSQRPTLDFSKAKLVDGKRNQFNNIGCQIHSDIFFKGTATKQHCTPCPECKKLDNLEKLKTAAPKAWASETTGSFVSKQETKWLDELGIVSRQVWLEDVKYKVDGYDKETNTVYLYHGRFWHGCPETYDPEMIHPIVKVPMKDLYKKTMYYENKIKEAGYNLIAKWGT